MTTFNYFDQTRSYRRSSRAFGWRSFGLTAAATEFVVILLASLACGALYHRGFGGVPGELGDGLVLGALLAPIFVTISTLQGRYHIAAYISAPAELKRPVGTWTAAILYTLAATFLSRTADDLSRGNVILLSGLGFLAIALWRSMLARYVTMASKTGRIAARRVLLIGSRDAIDDFALRYQPWNLGFEIVGQTVIGDKADSIAAELDRAAQMGRVLHPDDVFVLVPWSQTETIERIVDKLLTLPVSIHLGPERILDRYREVQVVKVSSMSTMRLVRLPLSRFEILVKRLFDFVVAAAALIMLLPVFAATAILIKLDSPGPVLFRQTRYGFNQRPFTILKFRTMFVNPGDAPVAQARRQDPRVTPVGRHLRRWNLDELPQLVNVLVGDMSIVGPRPHAVSHNIEFERRIVLYARRHNVRPGVTGWAQVNGFRGETDTDEKLRRRVEYDLYYIDNWSLAFDLRIIGLTVLSPKAYINAY